MTVTKNKPRNMSQNKKSEKRFILSIWIYPVILFLALYAYVNFSTIVLAFQRFNSETLRYEWNGIENFKLFLNDAFKGTQLRFVFKNSIFIFAFNLLVQLPIVYIVAFIVYKKIHFAGFFKIILFLPNIISSIVWVMLFKYIVEYGLPELFKGLGLDSSINLLGDPSKAFGTMIFYSAWLGLGSGLLVNLGTMSRIPEGLIEAGKLDGMNLLQELWHITLPLMWPIISISLIVSVGGFFTSQLATYAFYGENADYRLYTFGYYLFTIVVGQSGGQSNYAYAAAAGLMFTIVTAPLTVLVRYLCERFGPSVEY